MKTILSIAFLFTFTSPVFSQSYIENEKKMIVGTWEESETNWRLVFTTVVCYEYFDGKLVTTYDYKLSNKDFQCGQKVYVNNKEQTSYLQMTDRSNGVQTCYEINGVDKTSLSLSEFLAPTPSILHRVGKPKK